MNILSKTEQIWYKNNIFQSLCALGFLIIAIICSFTKVDWIYQFTDSFNHIVFPLFFGYVTLEARREVVSKTGHLRGQKAILPILMAFGGIIVPAVIYMWIQGNGFSPKEGLFIPIATDIAYVVLAMNTMEVSDRWKKTILAIAIADDIMALVLLAIFFEDWGIIKFSFIAFTIALVVMANIYEKFVDKVKFLKSIWGWLIIYGIFIYIFHELEIHTTLAAILIAASVPYKPGATRLEKIGDLSVSIYHTLEEKYLGTVCAWFIVPVFILVNVNIPFDTLSWNHISESTSIGIIIGLAIGKPFGIGLIVLLCYKWFGVPAKNTRELIGGLCLCGIGFTVSLFFAIRSTGVVIEVATVGILIGSILSFFLGYSFLWWSKKGHNVVLISHVVRYQAIFFVLNFRK